MAVEVTDRVPSFVVLVFLSLIAHPNCYGVVYARCLILGWGISVEIAHGIVFSSNAGNLRVVSPAEAGVQAVKLILRCHFSPWIPAFAGMTLSLSYWHCL